MERSPTYPMPPPPEHSTTKRRQRSLSPRPQDYHPARIRKVAWPRDAPKPSEAELRATFSRLAPVANVGVGTSNRPRLWSSRRVKGRKRPRRTIKACGACPRQRSRMRKPRRPCG